MAVNRIIRAFLLSAAVFLFASHAQAANCSGLPTHFSGNEFPSGDFFSNFTNPGNLANSCYAIGFASGGGGSNSGDLNATYWRIFYKVDPRYQLIVVSNFPNARYFSVTAYDDHSAISQTILDANIVPLNSSYVNPYQPGTPYLAGQEYAVAVNFGGTPGTLENGCKMNGYNVDVNGLDATLRHQGMNWNADPGVFQQISGFPLHNVDTPEHTNPTATGLLLVRAYMDISLADLQTAPYLIVRDVATGCAYPASYAVSTLQIVTSSASVGNTWLDQAQINDHATYETSYLTPFCYGSDSRSMVSFSRDMEFIGSPNPNASYVTGYVTRSPTSLASSHQVMRLRLRVPAAPPTPCTNGCTRSGNEQMRYMSLSLRASQGVVLASLADSAFTVDANGYATLIVGTGTTIPSWVTPANGYTYLDLTSIPGYQNLQSISLRNILPAGTFTCSGQEVPYNTTVYTPAGGLMGDYLPVVDYPAATSLPTMAAPLVGPNSCGVFPAGQPAVSPDCGVVPSNPITITSIIPVLPGESPVAVQPLPPITITGDGFGLLPNGLPYDGDTSFLQVTDITQNWSAGYTGNPCNLSISNWASNRIELVANVNQNGACPLAAGDQLSISIWNPQTLTGPATATVAVAPNLTYWLASNAALVGSAAGAGTVMLTASAPWVATSNASWLHLASGSTGGTSSQVIQFTYDANLNPGAQTGTLTIAGLTFTVTQAGTSYLPAAPMVNLVSTGLNSPQGVALDPQGNVYVADTGNNVIEEWNASTQHLAGIVSSGLGNPTSVATDGRGNLFVADPGNNAIEEWTAGGQLTPLVSGLSHPGGVAVDPQGNVYFSDTDNNAIREWVAASGTVTTLVPSGLSNPTGVAVDGQGNVYFADTRNNAIKWWNVGGTVVTIAGGLNNPTGVVADAQGNVFFSDTGNNAIDMWNAVSQQVTPLASTGLNSPSGLAVDGQGGIYVADTGNNAIKKFTLTYLALTASSVTEASQAGTDTLSVQVLPANAPVVPSSDQSWLTVTGYAAGTISFAFTANTSITARTGHINVLGQLFTVTQNANIPSIIAKIAGDSQAGSPGQAFGIPLQAQVTDEFGNPMQGASVVFTATAGGSGANGTFSTTPAMPVATDQNGMATAPLLTANGTSGSFTVTATVNGLSVTFNLLISAGYSLGGGSAYVGSAAGNGTVLLIANGAWTATSNAPWLHVAAGSASGVGSALIGFSYDANPNPGVQSGTLTIGPLTFVVTQAGAGYVQIYPVTTLVSTGLSQPRDVAVDGPGNVYIADTLNNAVKVWSPITGQVGTLVPSTAGLNAPASVAVDTQVNVYIADTGNKAIKLWNKITQALTTVVSGLQNPQGVAVDSQDNIYIADSAANAILEWNAASSRLTTLVGSGLNNPTGVAVDAQGNVYIADTGDNSIKEWVAPNGPLTVLVSAGLISPPAISVDGQGNVYITDTGNNAVKQWSAANQTLATLVSGLSSPSGSAIDGQGNIYLADTNNSAIRKISPAYLSLGATGRSEGPGAGTDLVTAQVLPASTPLSATSDSSWLSITSVTGGAINFSFLANPSVLSRVANITVLGPQVTVTQSGNSPASLLKAAGDNQSAALGQPFPTALQVTVADGNGIPISNAAVTFTVNPGAGGAAGTFASAPTMPVQTDGNGHATAPVLTANSVAGIFTVTATVGGLSATYTLTNLTYSLASSGVVVGPAASSGTVLLAAGGSWTAASDSAWLHLATSSGTGNSSVAFTYDANPNAAVRIGTLTISGLTFTVTQAGTSYAMVSSVNTLVSGLKGPQDVAVDSQGNVYIADTTNNAIKKLSGGVVTTLVGNGLSTPTGVAVDAHGNVYIADSKSNTIKKWTVATGLVTTVVPVTGGPALSNPLRVAVDSQGNVYFSDTGHNMVKEWIAATGQILLLAQGLKSPGGVALDSFGNVFFADTKNNLIKEWIATKNTVVTPPVSGFNNPYGMAVDGGGNVYIADTANNAIEEWIPPAQLATLVSSGIKSPGGVAVDAQRNVYIADAGDNAIKELTVAYISVGATSVSVNPLAGSGSIPVQVLPANTSLKLTSDQTWLTVTGVSGGTINFSYTTNASVASRVAHITGLGQQVTITQNADVPASLVKTAGSGQSTPVGHTFPVNLQVRVLDGSGNAIQGAAVTFTVTPGTKGCSGTFSSSMPVVTPSNGLATAPTLTANSTAGTFTVTASVSGTTATTTFTLTVSAH